MPCDKIQFTITCPGCGNILVTTLILHISLLIQLQAEIGVRTKYTDAYTPRGSFNYEVKVYNMLNCSSMTSPLIFMIPHP